MANITVRVPLPHDFLTHRASWRNAIEGMRDAAEERGDEANRSYWDHELRAFDRAHVELEQARKDPGNLPIDHPEVPDLRTALETAYRRLGGIAAIARSESGARKIVDIAIKEFAFATAVVPTRKPTAWIRLTGDRGLTADPRVVALWEEAGAAVLPLFAGPEVEALVREALDNSNSLLAAMLHEHRPAGEIEDQIVENRRALATLGPRTSEQEEEPGAPALK